MGSDQGPCARHVLENMSLVMCWMSVFLHGVNADRSVERSGRRLRFGPQTVLTLISIATSIFFIRRVERLKNAATSRSLGNRV